ncbi:MAG TPA: hypothetical protein VH186_33620 [Chloroflexia bacterium]|nr:hypothetical protein [Chloroflexia bacterium]
MDKFTLENAKIYKPRYPTRNPGFWFVVVSLLISYTLLTLFVIGVMNNNREHSFNWGGALVVMGIALILLAISVLVVYKLLRIQPKQLVLQDDCLRAYDLSEAQPLLEVEIPLDHLTLVTVTDVPVKGGLFPASFKGLLLRWTTEEAYQTPDSEDILQQDKLELSKAVSTLETATFEYVVSSRNLCDFDELFDLIFEIAPPEARGARLFRA